MAMLTKKDREEMLEHSRKAHSIIRKYDKHMEPYDEVDNLDHHLQLVVALLENN
jgi:hypothetical protein